MDALFQILGGNGLVIVWYVDGAGDGENMLYGDGRQLNDAIDLAAAFFGKQVDSLLRGGRKIGGDIGIAQSKVSKGPPTPSGWWSFAKGIPAAGSRVVEEGNILKGQ